MTLRLLKNRLIYLSTKFEDDTRESIYLRKAINESWKSIYHYLGKIERPGFTDDQYLKAHYALYFGALTKEKKDEEEFKRIARNLNNHSTYYGDTLLDQIFSPKRVNATASEEKLTIKEIYDYSQSIKSLVKTYHDAAHPESSNWTPAEKKALERINRLDRHQLFVVCVAALYSYRKSKSREQLLITIEKYGFLTTLSGYYFNVNGRIDNIGIAVAIIGKKITAEQAEKKYKDAPEKLTESTDFKDSIRRIGKEASAYYGWKLTRYFMFEYEQELKRLSKTSRELLDWSYEQKPEYYSLDHKTIEHIFPQKAADPYWKEKFSKYTLKEKNSLRNSLGNLLPVSHAKNASLSNNSFDAKKGSETNPVGYRYGCLSEIQVAHSEEWNAIEILRRGIYLLDFMESRWGLKIGTPQQKAEILGLEFVLEREGLTIQEIIKTKPTPPKPPRSRKKPPEEASQV
ncbi:HNH endonuclease [Pseudomonas aeruginosa]|nr:HNH endonuclease [Pseudomonas aeruginosa]MCO2215699.1 HNH endonuclease [Pseudomonas aeruginosa]MCO2224697.1 HNH endonuclease [Pseudomonas aeruginosa]MCO2244809.1 HNH endonuclease [Pseudomonas aeruginosa]MCO2263955.1 HNH endonuclease [Pseudomonas aeruginosa]